MPHSFPASQDRLKGFLAGLSITPAVLYHPPTARCYTRGEILIDFEAVIGLEVHAQLLTRSKMFCSCSAAYQDASPNSHVCPVCLGMPGTLPVINRQAVESTVMTGLALNCTINPHSKFDRKNYPYPDLMKGYQISQYDQPLCIGGWLTIDPMSPLPLGEGQDEDVTKKAGITRVHLEEDTAKLSHHANGGEGYSLVDVNRSGVPLMEIVGEPDLRSSEDAWQYLVKLRRILQYLGVSSGNLEEGNFRCDANVSIRPKGATEFGTKVEVKNMNSFRAVRRAIEFELKRQQEVLESGGRIVQETRGWVETRGETASQRSKEQAHDYRYFPEPDLPPMAIDPAWVETLMSRLPELPDAKRDRFVRDYGLPGYDARVLTETPATAAFFESTVGARAPAKSVSNWCVNELFRLLNATNTDIEHAKVTPGGLAQLIETVESGKISGATGKAVLEEMFNTGQDPMEIVQAKGLLQISGTDELAEIVAQVIEANPQPVADYRSGKQQAAGFLVGQVMRQTRGRANPGVVAELLKVKLSSESPLPPGP